MSTVAPRRRPREYWRLDGISVIKCTEAEWREFRKDARNFVICETRIDPGFLIRTSFLGVRDPGKPGTFFVTTVFTDCGNTETRALSHAGAIRHHRMERQRIDSVVRRNAWDGIVEDENSIVLDRRRFT